MHDTDALIVAHGQPSAAEEAEAALAGFAARLRAQLPGMRLASASMAAPGRLETELNRLTRGGLVYPLFMADGWFVRTALMERIGTALVEVMRPFGMEQDLPGVAARALSRHLDGGPGKVLLAAHGSASGRHAPGQAARDFAERLEGAMPGTVVEIGFLEQKPGIADAMVRTGRDALCLPFLAMDGNHMRRDVRRALEAGGHTGQILPVISQLAGADAVIADAILTRWQETGAPQRAAS